MIAVTFALPEESRDFRRRHTAQVSVTHSGAGPDAAARHIVQVLAERPEFVIAAGFAGGLDPRLRVGEIVVATNYSSPELLVRAGGVAAGAFAHADLPVETVAAKAALRATGAVAVDMESQPIATACSRAGVPLLVVRVISDPAGEVLPVPFATWFDPARQRPRPAPLVWFLVRHPSRILPFVRFVRGLRPARRALAMFLLRFLEA
ncbi:MAG: hypothetical protein WCF18_03840, partial [Chthoniobacteraceae bacterium]